MAKQKIRWSRLDNAAKIFPSTSRGTDTRVFRFGCELWETVDGVVLQHAVDKAIQEFPDFCRVLKKGIFWYYLEDCLLQPVVLPESNPPCHSMDIEDAKSLLFEVTYYRNQINLDMYHALSDGTGAMQFLKTILYHYLLEKHRGQFPDEIFLPDHDIPISRRSEDGFQKYYQKRKLPGAARSQRAYHLTGIRRQDETLLFLEGIASVQQVLQAAHNYHTTLTVFLLAVFLEAVHREMTLQEEEWPVIINIPVNLRNYFPTESAKNFFGMITVQVDFRRQAKSFDDLVSLLDSSFREQLQKEQLSIRMNSLAALEHNLFVRLAPLPVKNIVLRLARRIRDKGETCAVSNVGRIILPPEFVPYVKQFHVFASTLKLQFCLCSFEDRLQMGFSSAFAGTDIQRNFFRFLTEQDIDVEIACNDFYLEKGEEGHAVL